jgi:nucleotidyltransferase/DNA polymerase involved in DNA repair
MPLQAPARSISFKVLETVPGHGAQKNFFHTQEIEAENWDQLLGRLLSRLGPEHVFQATLVHHYCPEKSWQKTLNQKRMSQKESSPISVSAPSHASSHASAPTSHLKRPTRILKTPEPLHLKPSLLLHPSGKTWRVKAWEGPERILTEWWKEPFSREVNRDYYQITSEENEKIWVFLDRNQDPPQAFLHGFFD